VPVQRRGRGHLGADEVRPAAPSLAPLEVPVGRRGAALPRREDVGVHAEAHRAAGEPPLEPRVEEDLVEPLLLRLAAHLCRAGDDERGDPWIDLAALDDRRGGAQVLDPRVRARADEHPVDADLFDPLSRPEIHVLERPLGGDPVARVVERGGIGHRAGDRDDHARVRPPGHLRDELREIDDDVAVVLRVRVARERAPVLDGRLPVGAARRELAPLEIRERRLVGRDQSRAGAPFDRHVADRHALLHRQRADRLAGVLDDVADAAVNAYPADRAEDEVLRREAARERADELEQHRLRPSLLERLRREDVLDLRRADRDGERAEGAVRRGVAVAADDRLARLRQPELRADDVDDPLVTGARSVEADAELLRVRAQGVELRLRHRIRDRPGQGRDVVVHRRDRQLGAPHRSAREPQPLECLGGGDLVHEVQVDVEQRRLALLLQDDVGVPDLLEERAPHPHVSLLRPAGPATSW
jgi:hypothetical protein